MAVRAGRAPPPSIYTPPKDDPSPSREQRVHARAESRRRGAARPPPRAPISAPTRGPGPPPRWGGPSLSILSSLADVHKQTATARPNHRRRRRRRRRVFCGRPRPGRGRRPARRAHALMRATTQRLISGGGGCHLMRRKSTCATLPKPRARARARAPHLVMRTVSWCMRPPAHPSCGRPGPPLAPRALSAVPRPTFAGALVHVSAAVRRGLSGRPLCSGSQAARRRRGAGSRGGTSAQRASQYQWAPMIDDGVMREPVWRAPGACCPWPVGAIMGGTAVFLAVLPTWPSIARLPAPMGPHLPQT